MQSGYLHLTEYQGEQLRNTWKKKHDCLTAVLQKWRFNASYDSFGVGPSSVLRMKFSGENRHLRKAANRWLQQLSLPKKTLTNQK
jgi:hypothetical protein